MRGMFQGAYRRVARHRSDEPRRGGYCGAFGRVCDARDGNHSQRVGAADGAECHLAATGVAGFAIRAGGSGGSICAVVILGGIRGAVPCVGDYFRNGGGRRISGTSGAAREPGRSAGLAGGK